MFYYFYPEILPLHKKLEELMPVKTAQSDMCTFYYVFKHNYKILNR